LEKCGKTLRRKVIKKYNQLFSYTFSKGFAELFQKCGFVALFQKCLIELYHNLYIFFFNRFGSRDGEFFSLFAYFLRPGRGHLLPLGRAISTVHVLLNGIIIGLNVFNDIVLKCPLEKIELTDSGLKMGIVFIRYADSVPTAKRIKTFFTV
jgi:hypothetical protein